MKFPFIYGAQYYRAPTPKDELWIRDLKLMKAAGFTDVKFWAQWRWSERKEGEFYFGDLDALMELAKGFGLRVTINVICDVCPSYIYEKYPNCRPVDINGQVFIEREVSCRQIGGYPGPCYNHREAFDHRMAFIKELINRYKDHPAMFMWDMWNEPEHNLLKRAPKFENLFCYCDNCKKAFMDWLKIKYKDINNLNNKWGRCYTDFSQIELPRTGETIGDFLDYRLFALETMAKEAKARVEIAKEIDKNHPVYLHPVPNTGDCFNSLTGVDDFKMSIPCDCFAGTTNGFPTQPLQTTSSAKGKVCYNVESHLRYGSATMYAKHLNKQDFLNVFIPQVGLGIKGFMHWQFDSETLGVEAPAWGLNPYNNEYTYLAARVKSNNDYSVLKEDKSYIGAKEAGEYLKNLFDKGLLEAMPKKPEIGIYKSTSNDIVQFCINKNIDDLVNSINGWTKTLYAMSGNICYVNDYEVLEGIDENIKVLIMPYVYALTATLSRKLSDFVRRGGILVTEPHFGAYDIFYNRISQSNGSNIACFVDIFEINTTSPIHLEKDMEKQSEKEATDDVSKAMKAFGNIGSEEFPVKYKNMDLIGYKRYAEYVGEGLEVLGTYKDKPLIVKKQLGEGAVICMGSLFAAEFERQSQNPTGYWQDAKADAYTKNPRGDFKTFVYDLLKDYVTLDYENCGIRQDLLTNEKGQKFYCITNLRDQEATLKDSETSIAFKDIGPLTLPPKEARIIEK